MFEQFIIPAQTRTIYIQMAEIQKFKLNLPELLVKRKNCHWYVYAINEKGSVCYCPLPNIYCNGQICLRSSLEYGIGGIVVDKFDTKDKFLERFYNSKFTLSEIGSLANYSLNKWFNFKDAEKFYKNWENSGSQKLFPIIQLL